MFVMAHRRLWMMERVIENCCSDDETDVEETRLQESKVCKVRQLAWRSNKLGAAVVHVDELREQEQRSSPTGTPGVPPRIRTRGKTHPFSSKLAPVGLPIDCYSEEWLASLSTYALRDLKIIHDPIFPCLKNVLREL